MVLDKGMDGVDPTILWSVDAVEVGVGAPEVYPRGAVMEAGGTVIQRC